MTAPKAVEVEDLTVSITATGHAILESISISVAPGEVLAVVGESGSGKSTLGLALLGHARQGLAVTGGRVRVADHEVSALSPGDLARVRGKVVAYVPQDASVSLNPAHRIGALLDEILRAHIPGATKHDRLRRCLSVLTEVDLPSRPEFLRRFVHQLSGGQQQRLGIALALVSEPSVLVLDEPTTGLDPITQREILKAVGSACRSRNTAAIFITHDLEVVRTLADQVLVLYSGRVAELGSADKIIRGAGPVHPYTRALIESAPSVDQALELRGIRGLAPSASDRPAGCAFHPRCALAVSRCLDERPMLREVGSRHFSACHFPQEHPVAALTSPLTLPKADHGSDGLQAIDIKVAYHGYVVLDGVSLSVSPGSCVGLVGASGSGKTTVSRALAGLVRPNSGTVRLDGVDLASTVDRRSSEQRRAIQYVFQNPYSSLNPRRTVLQILEQPARAFGLDFSRAVATQWLDAVSLSARALDRRPEALSGGERQRVAIARALACKPRFLICDEITAPLDVSVQATIVELVRAIMVEAGVGLLFVSHDLGVMRSLADTVAIFQDGQCIETDRTERVFDEPRTDYGQALMSAARVVAR